jgi:E3 ubiquitin-protein ligase makorin
VWPESPEEKEEIIAEYKRKLAETDCMHFDFGEGKCPFGTSCFYRHAYKDGSLEVSEGGGQGRVKRILGSHR